MINENEDLGSQILTQIIYLEKPSRNCLPRVHNAKKWWNEEEIMISKFH